ncbi:GNAT family N-acetyltransferase [Aquibacillus salsiterrae]|uniref:N-acetyltransferase n=1 Tax=Aquibacillus salsiterrae TaxID=2950439 RepID=A0A9X3WF48_9BACI|nr:N-acetyltransferase [Aquibacillus salsiterrae]MDC3417135.1 N-acetyltransferase [Aquibacillus salsiterrae]
MIKEQVDYYRQIGQRFEWKVYSYDQPSNLIELLEDEGFMNDGPEALMVMDTSKTNLLKVEIPSEIKEITDRNGIEAIMKLEKTIWNDPLKGLGERLWRDKQRNEESLFLYGAYADSQLVSAAWMYLEGQSSFASLWGGSTLANHRGKGHYTGLLAIRARKAVEMGHPVLMVDASPMSKPILEKNGFECLAYSYGLQSP